MSGIYGETGLGNGLAVLVEGIVYHRIKELMGQGKSAQEIYDTLVPPGRLVGEEAEALGLIQYIMRLIGNEDK